MLINGLLNWDELSQIGFMFFKVRINNRYGNLMLHVFKFWDFRFVTYKNRGSSPKLIQE